uniref:hypothetical protein n=1 Tax=Pseudomonas aeruginosa TaxID=287 RepID=UPI00240959DB
AGSRGENRAAWARAAEIRAGKINLSPFFQKDGGVPTSVLKIFTDRAGNLITTFPIKAVD